MLFVVNRANFPSHLDSFKWRIGSSAGDQPAGSRFAKS